MKRKLREKLVLLVKQKGSALEGGSSSGSSKDGWVFPHVLHKEGETIRAAGERALRESVGVAEAFFIGNAPMAHHPLGGGGGGGSSGAASSSGTTGASSGASERALHTSAAAGHAASSGGGSSEGDAMFFMLAQVVNDPWQVELREAFASDHAWVTVEELPGYLKDDRLVELARKML